MTHSPDWIHGLSGDIAHPAHGHRRTPSSAAPAVESVTECATTSRDISRIDGLISSHARTHLEFAIDVKCGVVAVSVVDSDTLEPIRVIRFKTISYFMNWIHQMKGNLLDAVG